MTSGQFRLESNRPLTGRFLPTQGAQQYFFKDRSLAVAMAAKSSAAGAGEIRVVHVPTGEVVFRKSAGTGGNEDLA